MADPVLFLVTHNWREPAKKTLTWRTDVIVARAGSEQRRRIRTEPVETLTYAMSLYTDEELAWFRGMVANTEDLRIEFPRWEDELHLAAPIDPGDLLVTTQWPVDNRHFSTGQRCVLLLEGERYEIVTVEDATDDEITIVAPGAVQGWPAGTRLAPLAVGRLDAPISGSEHGDVKHDVAIVITVEEDIAGVGEGGENETMVAATVNVENTLVGSRDGLPTNGIMLLAAYAHTAAGILIPQPVIEWSFSGGAGVLVYPSGREGTAIVRHDSELGGGGGTVTATVDGVSGTYDL
jgi:hypothetical protein